MRIKTGFIVMMASSKNLSSTNGPYESLPTCGLFVNSWERLESFLTRLYDQEESVESWMTPEIYMSLYTIVYEFCVGKYGGGGEAIEERNRTSVNIQGRELYSGLCAFYERYLPREVTTILQAEDLIEAYLTRWNRYEMVAKHVEAVFNYLDRFWITRERQDGRLIPYIYPLLWSRWDHIVLKNLEEKLFNHMEQVLSRERMIETQTEPNILVQNLIASFHTLSSIPKGSLLQQSTPKVRLEVYPFQERLLLWYSNALDKTCTLVLNRMMDNGLSTLEIARRVHLFWKAEVGKSKVYLDGPGMPIESSIRRVKKSLKRTLLEPILDPLNDLVRSSLTIEEDPSNVIRVVYELLAERRSLLPKLTPAMEEGMEGRLRTKLPRINNAEARPEQLLMLVSLLFAMFQEGRGLVKDSMMNDAQMVTSIDLAFKNYIHGGGTTTGTTTSLLSSSTLGEYLARWIDRIIRDQEGLSPEHPAIQFMLTILRIIDERETFQQYSARLLVRRLLARQSFIQRSAEDALLGALSSTYGIGFVSNQRRMLADVESSIDLTHRFLTGRGSKRAKLPFELSFQIATSGSWPVTTKGDESLQWDDRLRECIDSFGQFYSEQHNGRILYWSPSLTAAEVSTIIGGRSYSFIISALQYAIIKRLEEAGGGAAMSLKELSIKTGISLTSLNSALRRLVQVQLVVLMTPLKEGAGGDDLYRLNSKFSSPHSRLNLCTLSDTERIIETVESSRGIVEDRSLIVQARIVRHLKSTKECSLQGLTDIMLGEEGEGLDEINRALMSLIEKEYIMMKGDLVVYLP